MNIRASANEKSKGPLRVVSTQSIFGKLPFKCEIFVAANGALATPASNVLPTEVMKVRNVR